MPTNSSEQFSNITVDEYSTPCPIVVPMNAPVATAISIMQEHSIRHLPVVDGQRVVGIISDRDTRIATAGYENQISIANLMQPAPYHVEKNTPLLDVVFHLSEEKIGSAIITDDGKLDGIFTTTDALNALVDMLKSSDSKGLYTLSP